MSQKNIASSRTFDDIIKEEVCELQREDWSNPDLTEDGMDACVSWVKERMVRSFFAGIGGNFLCQFESSYDE